MKVVSDEEIRMEPARHEEVKGYDGIYNRLIKRIVDVLLALIFIIILIPVFVIISIFILIESGFPVFYKAERGGYKGESFKIYKFRSMIKNADQIGGGTTALNDSRITKVGHVLRKTKLDEIPQLFNVIKGEMSFIGPRPELIAYTSQYTGDEENIFQVRPGITDFSSIQFIHLEELVGDENADEVYEKEILKRKNQLRVKYAREVSFKTDVALFFKTVWLVIHRGIQFIVKK